MDGLAFVIWVRQHEQHPMFGHRWTRWMGFAGLLWGTMPGCGKGGIAGEFSAFTDAGHTVSGIADVEASTFGAKKCQTSTVQGLSVLLCEYANVDAAALAQTAAEGWIGEAPSGVVLRRDSLLMACADRGHADTDGKILSSVGRVFRRLKAK